MKRQILDESTDIRYLAKLDSETQKVEWGFPGSGSQEGNAVSLFNKNRVPVLQRVLKMDRANGGTTKLMYIILLNLHFKIAKILP